MEIRFLDTDDAGEYWRLRLEALERAPEAFSSSAEEHKALTLADVEPRALKIDDRFIDEEYMALDLRKAR